MAGVEGVAVVGVVAKVEETYLTPAGCEGNELVESLRIPTNNLGKERHRTLGWLKQNFRKSFIH